MYIYIRILLYYSTTYFKIKSKNMFYYRIAIKYYHLLIMMHKRN